MMLVQTMNRRMQGSAGPTGWIRIRGVPDLHFACFVPGCEQPPVVREPKSLDGCYVVEDFYHDARFYRHRGHRYISVRRFDEAAADLARAAELSEGVPDVVGEDGAPNAAGIPRSTSHSNIWYHLGLAYYLQGEFERAAELRDEIKELERHEMRVR